GPERVPPGPRPAARPLLGAVLPRRLSAQDAALGSGEGGPERLPHAAARLRLGLPLPELRQRTAAGAAGGGSRFSDGAAAQPERGRALRPVPHPRHPLLPAGGVRARGGRLPRGEGAEARPVQRLPEPGTGVSRTGAVRAGRGADGPSPAAPAAGPGGLPL